MKPKIPTELRNVDKNWALSVLCHIQNSENSYNPDFQQFEPDVNTFVEIEIPKVDTVLSDICKVHIRIQNENGVAEIHEWFVKIIPSQFKNLVTKHKLFEKEIAFYR